MAQWKVNPEISFRYDTFMMVHKRPLVVDDISPAYLRDVIDVSEDILFDQMAYLHAVERQLSPNRILPRPVIMIARLALCGHESETLTMKAISLRGRNREILSDLRPEYKPYWASVSETAFDPIVQSNIVQNDPVVDGAWIGIRNKNRF